MRKYNPIQSIPPLFRIWNERTKQYVDRETTLYLGIASDGKVATENPYGVFDVTAPEVYGWEVEMWTGTWDDFGQPLYVGDLVRTWTNSEAMVCLLGEEPQYGLKYIEGGSRLGFANTEFKIIGTIHDYKKEDNDKNRLS